MSRLSRRVLFLAHGLHLGGVERSLIGLLRALPIDVEVSLFLYDHSGELLPQVPKHVKILKAVSAYSALVGSIRNAIESKHYGIAFNRLIARFVVVLRSAVGFAPGFLLARSHRYAAIFLPKIVGDYDLAISFLTPHDIVAKKVNTRCKVGWIHTDYSSVETGVAVNFEQKAWESMNQIIAVSPEVAASFAKVFPELSTRVTVIENVLDSAWVRLRAVEQKPTEMEEAVLSGYLVLCTVGRFSHAKGFDIAVEAARKLRDAGFKFRWYIIGFGPDELIIRQKIKELGVHEEFILLGARENPYPYMAACDIYVQPSRYEGKAVSIREAQMLGKPVLVSDFPTVRSQIEHGIDGYITPAGVDGLVEGIRLLIQDSGLRDRLGKTTASRDYSNLSEARKVLDLVPKN